MTACCRTWLGHSRGMPHALQLETLAARVVGVPADAVCVCHCCPPNVGSALLLVGCCDAGGHGPRLLHAQRAHCAPTPRGVSVRMTRVSPYNRSHALQVLQHQTNKKS